MRYALNLAEDGRVLSVTFAGYAPDTHPMVEALPEGDVSEYRYVDGAFLHEPQQEQAQPEAAPTQLDRVEAQAFYTAMMTDTLLEV